MGRRRSEASPVKTAEIGVVAIMPMTRREPVPELPKSSTSAGAARPPTPTPWTDQLPGPCCVTSAPKARMAAAVSRTSSASSRPGDPGFAHRQRPQNQGPVRDRLVAGHRGTANQRAGGMGGQRTGRSGMGHGMRGFPKSGSKKPVACLKQPAVRSRALARARKIASAVRRGRPGGTAPGKFLPPAQTIALTGGAGPWQTTHPSQPHSTAEAAPWSRRISE